MKEFRKPDFGRLYVQSGPDRGREIVLGKAAVTLGRSRSADFRLTDPLVSAEHLRLATSGGLVLVEDLGSANGTKVDGNRLERNSPRPTRFGSIIEVGDTLIELIGPDEGPGSGRPTPSRKADTRQPRRKCRKKSALAGVALSVVAVATGISSFVTYQVNTQRGHEGRAFGEWDQVRQATVLVDMGRGYGSGIVIDSGTGLVVTNHHVTAGARVGAVRAPGLATWSLRATVLAASPCDDIALLQVGGDPDDWPELRSIEFPDHEAEAGDSAFAVGYPANTANATGRETGISLTGGIVSNTHIAYDDPLSGVMPLEFLIEHDAPIKPGNSGGPLVDDAGRLLGMNTALYALGDDRSGNHSYAITAEHVSSIVDTLSTGESIGDFGLLLEPYLEPVFEGDRSGEPNALLVRSLDKGGPAETAGIQQGGLIISVGDTRVRDLASWCSTTQASRMVDVGFANTDDNLARFVTLKSY